MSGRTGYTGSTVETGVSTMRLMTFHKKLIRGLCKRQIEQSLASPASIMGDDTEDRWRSGSWMGLIIA